MVFIIIQIYLYCIAYRYYQIPSKIGIYTIVSVKKILQSYLLLNTHDADVYQKCFICCSVVYSKLQDKIMPLVHQRFEEDDEYLFEKSKILANMAVTAEQFGAKSDYAVRLSAAVSNNNTWRIFLGTYLYNILCQTKFSQILISAQIKRNVLF